MKLIRWLRKRWRSLSVTLVALLLIAAFLFPYLLKRYIEAHSEEWIGRRVTIGSITLNPFTGVYAVNHLTCYEPQDTAVFVSFEKLGVKADLLAGYRKGRWSFREAELRVPYVHIQQNGDRFNFGDLLELGGKDTAEALPEDTSMVVFDVEGMALTDGRVAYGSDLLHEPVVINDLDVSCTRISSGQATMDFLLGFVINGDGRVEGGFTIDTEKGSYDVNAHLRGLDLAPTLPYVQDLMDCRSLRGALDIDVRLHDSYVDTTSLALSAAMELRSFELVDPNGDALLGIGALHAELDTLIGAEERFAIGDGLLDGADLHFTLLNDWSDNWTRLLRISGDSTATGTTTASESNIFVMLAEYVSYLGRQFVASTYSARSVKLTNCAVRYDDYTPRRPFHYEVTDLALTANSVSSDQEAGRIGTSATLNGTGRLTGTATFDPGDLRNVRIELGIDGLRLAPFDPYSRWYAAHPMEEGTAHYTTTTSVLNGAIDSRNALRIDRLKFGRKTTEHDTGIYVLPLRLASGLLKDVHGVVELDVPVKGDLKDPKFRVWPIVWQVFKNLILKAVAAPANLLARAVGSADERDLEELRFEPMQAVPTTAQFRNLDQLVRALAAKPELRVDLVSVVDAEAELQELALFAGKKQILFGANAVLTAADSARITSLSNTDSMLVSAVEAATPKLGGKPLQLRCAAMVGEARLQQQQQDIEYARREHTMQYLLAKGLDPARVAYRDGTPEETRGHMGDPGYRFIYDATDTLLDGNAAP